MTTLIEYVIIVLQRGGVEGMEKPNFNSLFTVIGAYRILKAYYGREPRPCEFKRITDYTEAAYYKLKREHAEACEKPLSEESYKVLEMLAEVIMRGDTVI